MALSLTVSERTSRVVATDLDISILGECRYPSPLTDRLPQNAVHYVGQADRVLLDDQLSHVLQFEGSVAQAPSFELAGPRHKVFFDPKHLRCGIVTCGGLCPGLNNVVRGIVLALWQSYGVEQIYGFRYGYAGLARRHGHGPVRLNPAVVADIHHEGGTMLGTSRGNQDPREIVDRLDELGIGVLFVIGGDGTFRGAMTLVDEIRRRRLPIGIIGVPKTIDNDIHFIDRSFGFETAFSAAVDVIRSAHVEANGTHDCISIVKLMGRHSGFIACHAALASTDVDVVLIPEVPVRLHGPNGLFNYLERRLEADSHALIVIAEGAGQDLCDDDNKKKMTSTDASGNVKLSDVGLVMRDKIVGHFQRKQVDVTVKYIDPSYYIRSVPAAPPDSVYCWNLARNAVHAAMAGNTDMLIGRWHGRFVHVPLPLATRFRKQVNTEGDLWTAVLEATGQPKFFEAPAVDAQARVAG